MEPDQDARGIRLFKRFVSWNDAIMPVLSEGSNGAGGVREMGTKATQLGNAALDWAS